MKLEESPLRVRPFSPGTTEDAITPFNLRLAQTFVRHSLGWLVAANVVGVWLAANLVWPQIGEAVAPLTYGRWMPLHTDWLLYGWCALPLVALLFAWVPCPDRRHAQIVSAGIVLWSAVLAVSGAYWLSGHVSGKLFLATNGARRLGLPLTIVLLWACLAANLWHAREKLKPGARWGRASCLVVLLVVPLALFWAGDEKIYPAVNPQSGGATGASLLGSTLVVLGIIGGLPWALRIKPGNQSFFRRLFLGGWLLSLGLFALIDRGDVSHHDPAAIAALATLLIWIPILPGYLRAFAWHSAPHWRHALVGWWTLLAVSGFVSFLPGFSEALKFTNGLVAHAHLAMAGFATSLVFVILQSLARDPVRHDLANSTAFFAWQTGNLLFVGTMTWLGWREAHVPGVLFHGDGVASTLYALRLLAGTVMAVTATWWFVCSRQAAYRDQ
jgi:cytochrome c oxidase cbb3-type subunit 1